MRAAAGSLWRAVLGAAVLEAVLGLAAADARAAAPCATATPTCVEWVAVSGATMRSPVYRSHPLTTRDERITAAFILVHGGSRDADQYYRHALAAAFLAGALENVLPLAFPKE